MNILIEKEKKKGGLKYTLYAPSVALPERIKKIQVVIPSRTLIIKGNTYPTHPSSNKVLCRYISNISLNRKSLARIAIVASRRAQLRSIRHETSTCIADGTEL